MEPGERRFYGIDFVKEAEEQVQTIQKNMTVAQARQKSYADKRRKPIEFDVGDHVYLKVSPMKGVKRFGIKRYWSLDMLDLTALSRKVEE